MFGSVYKDVLPRKFFHDLQKLFPMTVEIFSYFLVTAHKILQRKNWQLHRAHHGEQLILQLAFYLAKIPHFQGDSVSIGDNLTGEG